MLQQVKNTLYNQPVKKTKLLTLLLAPNLLTSCEWLYSVYEHWIDENYNLRFVQYSEKSKALAVDEYYYREDKYSGDITIDITIPASIGGMPIEHFGRYSTTEISDSYYHDTKRMSGSSDINFAIICFAYFEEGTVINLNINIEADLEGFELFAYSYGPLEFLNNNDIDSNYGYAPECNLYISITEDSDKYYSIAGEVYERRDDGEDRKLTTRNPDVSVHGNMWPS